MMDEIKSCFDDHLPDDRKLMYVCENVNDMSIEQRRELAQMALRANETAEKNYKSVGEGIMIRTDSLSPAMINAAYTYVKKNLSVEM